MLDGLYGNIGGKIKCWAKWIFILGAVGISIFGLAIMLIGMSTSTFLTGTLIIAIGVFSSWISSWLLYAFGELVEKSSRNEANTRAIVKLLQDSQKDKQTFINAVPSENNQNNSQNAPQPLKTTRPDNSTLITDVIAAPDGEIFCPLCNCKQPSNRKICWNCSATFVAQETKTHLWRCDNCGNMRSQTPCEHCGNN